MKHSFLIILLMTTLSAAAQFGVAKTEKKTFSRTTTISEIIEADRTIIWALLTNASDYTRWNSTIVSLDGEIQEGEKLKLKSTLDPDRTFKLKVKAVIPEEKLVWGDVLGNRVYTLEKKETGTLFSMSEKIASPMFPLFAGKIPPFDESFEQFTMDLKNEAEAIEKGK